MKIYFRLNQWGLRIITAAGRDIGHVGVGLSSQLSTGRAIGYSIDEEFRGRGIMPRAVKAWIEYSDLTVFQAVTLPNNESSKRVLLKCGFKHVNFTETSQNPDARWVFEYVKAETIKRAA